MTQLIKVEINVEKSVITIRDKLYGIFCLLEFSKKSAINELVVLPENKNKLNKLNKLFVSYYFFLNHIYSRLQSINRFHHRSQKEF